MAQKIGPVQLLAIGFDQDARFEGKIMDELANLERHETIRILDLLFVRKDAETGDLLALDYQGEELGAIVGALLGFDFEDEQPSHEVSEVEGHAFGLSQEEIQGIAASLKPGSSPGFLLIEHVWACELKRAIRETGGFPLGEGFLTPRPSLKSLPSFSPCQRPSRNSRPRRRAPGRRENQASRSTNRKENVDGTSRGTSRRQDAGAAELPDHGAHAAAPLVRPEQAWDEGRL